MVCLKTSHGQKLKAHSEVLFFCSVYMIAKDTEVAQGIFQWTAISVCKSHGGNAASSSCWVTFTFGTLEKSPRLWPAGWEAAVLSVLSFVCTAGQGTMPKAAAGLTGRVVLWAEAAQRSLQTRTWCHAQGWRPRLKGKAFCWTWQDCRGTLCPCSAMYLSPRERQTRPTGSLPPLLPLPAMLLQLVGVSSRPCGNGSLSTLPRWLTTASPNQ